LPSDYLPLDCLNDGYIVRDILKKLLEKFQLADIINDEIEFDKLWSKFDLNNVGMVHTNVFLRLLNYRVNLADELDADIQRIVSRSNIGRLNSRRSSSLMNKYSRTHNNRINPVRDNTSMYMAPPTSPSLIDTSIDHRQQQQQQQQFKLQTNNDNNRHEQANTLNIHSSTNDISRKFRTTIQQHRRIITRLHDTDDFLPYLDRKVNTC
jgi:hypothetical protein